MKNPQSIINDNTLPGISLLIPFYNPGKRLEQALRSAIQLQYPNLEIVLCNDGSTDDSLNQVQDLIQKSPIPITLISNPTRMGIPYTRNRLMETAKHPYLAWLDADDTTHPLRLYWQMQALIQNPNAAMCVAEALYVYANKTRYKRVVRNPLLLKTALFFKQPFPFSSCLVKKDCVAAKFNTRYFRAQDFDWIYKFLHNSELCVVHKPVVRVHILPDSQKPDIGSTQKILTQIQLEKLHEVGVHSSESEAECLVIFLRNRKSLSSARVKSALVTMKKVVKAWPDPNTYGYIRALYGYYCWAAFRSHGVEFFTLKPLRDLPVVWQLMSARV